MFFLGILSGSLRSFIALRPGEVALRHFVLKLFRWYWPAALWQPSRDRFWPGRGALFSVPHVRLIPLYGITGPRWACCCVTFADTGLSPVNLSKCRQGAVESSFSLRILSPFFRRIRI